MTCEENRRMKNNQLKLNPLLRIVSGIQKPGRLSHLIEYAFELFCGSRAERLEGFE